MTHTPPNSEVAYYLKLLEESQELITDDRLRALVLWILAKTPAAHKFCNTLATAILHDLKQEWPDRTPLEILGMSLNALHAFSPQKLDGMVQGALAKRLVASESQPGGPYFEHDGSISESGNMQIGLLVADIAKPLPNIEKYTTYADAWVAGVVDADNSSGDGTSLRAARRLRTLMEPQTLGSSQRILQKNKNLIYEAARGEIETLAPYFRPQIIAAINALKKADRSGEVGLLPLMYAQSLQSRPPVMTDTLCRELGIANIFCWVAYTIFDDFIDAEGVAATMPVATYAQRAMLKKYMDITETQDCYVLVSHIFMTMDEANSWELNHCRAIVKDGTITIETLPDYTDFRFLYERSLGHALGPLLLQQRADSSRVESLKQALCHYLIARQMNDDLHDWADDLASGQLSAVVSQVLRDAKLSSGSFKIEETMPQLRQVFWQTTAASMCEIILLHCRAARQLLVDNDLLRAHSPLVMLIQRLEDATEQSLRMRTDGEQFIQKWSTHKR